MTVLPQQVIARKRDGFALAPAEINQFVAGLNDGTVSSAQVGAFAMAVYLHDMNADERVALTASALLRRLASQG